MVLGFWVANPFGGPEYIGRAVPSTEFCLKGDTDPKILQARYPQVPGLLQLSDQSRDRERYPVLTHRIGYDEFCLYGIWRLHTDRL